MKMQQRQFRIGELAKQVGVERFVIRFWEKEFNLRPTRSEGGQRFYQESDLHKFQLIKKLLHQQGFTIAGAKKVLNDKRHEQRLPTTDIQVTPATHDLESEFIKQLTHLKQHLLRLYELLS